MKLSRKTGLLFAAASTLVIVGCSTESVDDIEITETEANPQLQAMLDNVDDTVSIDVAAMLPASLHVYNFAGSFTTPPCSEGVNWHVATTPVTASKEQIETLNGLMGNNARPVQPLNDRKL